MCALDTSSYVVHIVEDKGSKLCIIVNTVDLFTDLYKNKTSTISRLRDRGSKSSISVNTQSLESPEYNVSQHLALVL